MHVKSVTKTKLRQLKKENMKPHLQNNRHYTKPTDKILSVAFKQVFYKYCKPERLSILDLVQRPDKDKTLLCFSTCSSQFWDDSLNPFNMCQY